ncbi:DUF2784 domain-containing protein [Vreelandella gomseomensis]|uniref:DUF2784 domain-containing protein n=1 Tax=Vreelandella gomseomensis TaxID=370766 RepID=A0ABU1G9U2_9GAMM|nr:DUF2784 domain-containing protein [Halomonas gomseomensis]MDR5874062.1 DUF2784 domain-containing protein [Halomonas gomseomensis]
MMSNPGLWLLLADALLVIHVLFVAFVVLGLLAVYAGYFLNWQWVRNRVFRIVHLGAIGYVVVQSWLGAVCPLTTWEMALRAEAGAATYAGSFIQHWLQSLLYHIAPDWVFMAVYTVFGGLVLASWSMVRPGQRQR